MGDFSFGIEVTKRCNFRCAHCFVDAGGKGAGELTNAEIRTVLKGLAATDVRIVGWSGGEPLLRKDLEELTAFGVSLGLRLNLVSNGYLATRERLAGLRAAGLEVIQISLDGASPTRAARFRQGPRRAFERAVEAIRNSVELGLQTYVCSLLAPATFNELEEMVALYRSLGAYGLRYAMWMPVGRAEGDPYDAKQWEGAEMRRFLETLHRAWRLGLRVLLDCPSGPKPGARAFGCIAGRSTGYVTAEGDVYPCTALMRPEYLAGNVRQTAIAEIINGDAMLTVQREIAAATPRGLCASCNLGSTCRFGCPGRTIALRGGLPGPDRLGEMPGCLYQQYTHGRGA